MAERLDASPLKNFLAAAPDGPEGSAERTAAEARMPNEASAVLGIVSAVGAFGGFLIPITFGSPWVSDPVSAVKTRPRASGV